MEINKTKHFPNNFSSSISARSVISGSHLIVFWSRRLLPELFQLSEELPVTSFELRAILYNWINFSFGDWAFIDLPEIDLVWCSQTHWLAEAEDVIVIYP